MRICVKRSGHHLSFMLMKPSGVMMALAITHGMQAIPIWPSSILIDIVPQRLPHPFWVPRGLGGGVLVTDRYAAYNSTNPAERQTCLAHIIRRAKEIAQELSLLNNNYRDLKAESFCARIAKLFSRVCKVGQKISSGLITIEQIPAIEKKFIENLKTCCANELSFSSAETLRSKLIGKEIDQLFTFLRHPDVPPTNNQAEQSLRSIVIFRKIIFGTRSASGLRTHSILPSLVLTARRQGNHPREFLQILLTSDSPTAQAALYNNSS